MAFLSTHLEIGPSVRAMQYAVFDDPRLHRTSGEIAQIVGGELARIDLAWQGGDLGVRHAELAELVIIEEEHPDFGILGDPEASPLEGYGVP